MSSADGYYVVGVYEDFRLDVFPTHASPIIVERGALGYRRWRYRIETPYRIRLLVPVGEFQSSSEELFPVLTYRLCEPRTFSDTCQVVALSQDVILVETNRLAILFKLLLASLMHIGNRGYLGRAWVTIWNAKSAPGTPVAIQPAAQPTIATATMRL